MLRDWTFVFLLCLLFDGLFVLSMLLTMKIPANADVAVVSNKLLYQTICRGMLRDGFLCYLNGLRRMDLFPLFPIIV